MPDDDLLRDEPWDAIARDEHPDEADAADRRRLMVRPGRVNVRETK